MTPREYVRKVILTDTAKELLTTDDNIIDIALNSGYETHEGFTRAFKKFHGVNPGVAKKGIILSCVPAINMNNLKKGEINMDIKIEKENAIAETTTTINGF